MKRATRVRIGATVTEAAVTAGPVKQSVGSRKRRYEELRERYITGDVPWDAALPPPEVVELVAALPPGRALDLGCGYGRSAIFLAERGWDVDGVDFVPEALEEARRRAAARDVRVAFHLASIPELDFLAPPYDLALDVGCGHALAPVQLQRYHRELKRLVRPGGPFLNFARIAAPDVAADVDDDGDAGSPPGLDEDAFRRLFAGGFSLERFERGITEMDDGSSWISAWFWWRRRTEG